MMVERSIDLPGNSLWEMIVSPTIWAIHFLACYITAAIYCAKSEELSADLADVRIAIAMFTVIALGGIAYSGIRAVRRGGLLGETAPHDADTIDDRRRFISYANLLLSGLSFVATLYVALPAVFIETCR